MGMYIAINDSKGWGCSGGVFDCIVEGTRPYLQAVDCVCVKDIYQTLDDEGQSFIVLDDVDADCFMKFYRACEAGMNGFPTSERGHDVPASHVPGIVWHWSEVLRLMREDPRFSA